MRSARLLAAASAVLLLSLSTADVQRASSGSSEVCTSPRVHLLLDTFVRAFNSGNLPLLNQLFAPQGSFVWYSSNAPGLRANPQAQDRSTLIGYFRRRHAMRDRLGVLSFRFNGNSSGLGNFIFRMRRRADDHRGGASFRIVGKGAALCTRPVAFVVLSLGAPGTG
jgi:hypothetical protein